MRSVVITTVLLSGLLTGTSLKAEEDSTSGNYYYRTCKLLVNDAMKDTTDALEIGDCLGTIKAINALNIDYGKGKGVFYCLPPTVTIGQMIKVAIAYMEKNPNLLHEPFTTLVISALNEPWPCKRD
jgi:hypothetical protein